MADAFDIRQPPPKVIADVVTTKVRRRWGGIALRMTTISIIVLLGSAASYPFIPRSYTGSAMLLVQATNKEGATTWDQSVTDALDDNAVQTKIDLLRSVPLQMAVMKEHNLVADPEYNTTLEPAWMHELLALVQAWVPEKKASDLEQVITSLLRHLSVKRERKSYLMEIGYESRYPEKAADLTNSLAKEFVAAQLGRKRESHERLVSVLKERIDTLDAQYHADELTEHGFVVKSGLIHTGEKESLNQQVITLSTALADAERRTVETANRARAFLDVSQKAGGLDGTNESMISPVLTKLRERLAELTSGAGSLNVPVGANTNVLGSLRQAIESESRQLLRAAQMEASVAQLNETALQMTISRIDIKLMQWAANERHRDDLHRAVARDLDAIRGADERYMQEAGRGDVLQPDVEVISYAQTPEKPSFPNPLLYAAGTMAVLLLLNGLVLLPSMLRHVNEA